MLVISGAFSMELHFKECIGIPLIIGLGMAWWCQATSHNLNQCWLNFMKPYGVARVISLKEINAVAQQKIKTNDLKGYFMIDGCYQSEIGALTGGMNRLVATHIGWYIHRYVLNQSFCFNCCAFQPPVTDKTLMRISYIQFPVVYQVLIYRCQESFRSWWFECQIFTVVLFPCR